MQQGSCRHAARRAVVRQQQSGYGATPSSRLGPNCHDRRESRTKICTSANEDGVRNNGPTGDSTKQSDSSNLLHTKT